MGSPHISLISHLLLYLSFWLLVPGLIANFTIVSYTVCFMVTISQLLSWEMATSFCKFRKPLLGCMIDKVSGIQIGFGLVTYLLEWAGNHTERLRVYTNGQGTNNAVDISGIEEAAYVLGPEAMGHKGVLERSNIQVHQVRSSCVGS